MSSKVKKSPAPLGRPRAFDADVALDKALALFWRKGYEGTSLSDLTEAMGINRPSLYAAFGNKEELFRKALDRYIEKTGGVMLGALAQPTAREAAAHLLYHSAEASAGPEYPNGCLLVQGALACGEEADPIRLELIARRQMGQAMFRERLERAKVEGDLSPDADCAALARFISTVTQGMHVQAATGATPEELRAVAEVALKAWPN